MFTFKTTYTAYLVSKRSAHHACSHENESRSFTFIRHLYNFIKVSCFADLIRKECDSMWSQVSITLLNRYNDNVLIMVDINLESYQKKNGILSSTYKKQKTKQNIPTYVWSFFVLLFTSGTLALLQVSTDIRYHQFYGLEELAYKFYVPFSNKVGGTSTSLFNKTK